MLNSEDVPAIKPVLYQGYSPWQADLHTLIYDLDPFEEWLMIVWFIGIWREVKKWDKNVEKNQKYKNLLLCVYGLLKPH